MKEKLRYKEDQMLDKIKTWAKDHEDQIKTVVGCGAIVVGGIIFYSKSFDYGYNCRINLEKAAGNGLFEAIEKFGNEEI